MWSLLVGRTSQQTPQTNLRIDLYLLIFLGQEAGNFGATNGAGSLCHPATIRSCFDFAVSDGSLFTTLNTITFKLHVESPFLIGTDVLNNLDYS